MADLRDRFAGCLVGQCVGDAVGFPVEGAPAAVCTEWVDSIRSAGVGAHPIGQYTDDSQLARELAISCVEREGFDPADYGARIARIFIEDRVVGRGLATHNAAMRLHEGVPWHASGEPPPAAGNGTTMRAAPIGMLFMHDHATLVEAACNQGRSTHRDPRCDAGSVAIAMATALAADCNEVDVGILCAAVAAQVAPLHAPFADLIGRLPEIVPLDVGAAAERIAPAARDSTEHAQQPYHWDGISPYVVPSVLWSLYAFLGRPDDFLEAVLVAIEPGGDVDTTGAMTGAIAGAHHGIDAIPAHFRALVHDDGAWREPELVDLAHRLCDLAERLRG